jgi:hypothetical protein
MSVTEMVPVPQAGQVVRADFGGSAVERSAETASNAMAAAAKASIEAAYIVALRRPRNMDNIRALLKKACSHPAFADLARFRKPVGKELNDQTGEWEEKIAEGLSIRFAEEAARVLGNLDMNSMTIYDDDKKKLVRFVTVDLENNTTWGKTVTIDRTTERTKLKDGQQALATRINSKGKLVFVVEATPAEVAKYEGAEGSKAWRDQILKSLPAHVKGECLQLINDVLMNEAAEDPDKAKKLVLDSFASIGVLPIHLQEYLGHEMSIITPAELVDLRTLYRSIEQGETTWLEIIEQRRDVQGQKAKPAAAAVATTTVIPGNAVDAAVAESRRKREEAAKVAAPKAAAAKATPAAQPAATKATPEFRMSTTKQRNEIATEATAAGLQISDVCKWYGVAAITMLPFEKAEEALARIREMATDPGDAPEPGSSDPDAA